MQHELEKEGNDGSCCQGDRRPAPGAKKKEKTRSAINILHQKMTKEISLAKQKTSEQELILRQETQELKSQLSAQLWAHHKVWGRETEEHDWEEVEKLRASYQDTQRYEAVVHTTRQQAENLQHDLEKDMEAHAARVTEDVSLEVKLRAEINILQKRRSYELSSIVSCHETVIQQEE